MTMKKTIILIITCVCVAASANAQQGSGRLSLGTGLLYKNGMDITLAYEHEMNYRHAWSFSSTATYNGQSAVRAVISVRNHFGETTAATVLAWPTSRA